MTAQPEPAQFILPVPGTVPLAPRPRDALLRLTQPACIIAAPLAGAAEGGRMDRGLLEAAHRAGIPVLKAIGEEPPHRVGADGAYLGEPGVAAAEVADWRDALGPEGMLVVFCGTSRHAAMEAAEAGADAIAFGGEGEMLLDLIGWWSALMEIPCIAAGAASPDQAIALVHAGADFVMPDPELWAGGPQQDDVPAALVAIAEAVADAAALAGAPGRD